MYWWDDRDGESMKGWWIAPVVGGEHVWTQCTTDSEEPPRTGWKVPWHGSVDRGVTMTPRIPIQKRSSPAPLERPGAPDRAKFRYGESRTSNSNSTVQPAIYASHSTKSGHQQPPRQEVVDDRGGHQVNVAEEAVRKAVAAVTGDIESADKIIRFAKNSVQSASRVCSSRYRSRVEKMESELSVTEKKLKAEIKDREVKILDEIKGDKIKQLREECDKELEEAQDASGLLNSDVADHLGPEDVFEATGATEKKLVTMQKLIDQLRGILVEKEDEVKRLNRCGGSLGFPFKEISEFRSYVTSQDKKCNEIKALADKYKKKANHDVAQRKKEEEEARRKELLEQQRKEGETWLKETTAFVEETREVRAKITETDPTNVIAATITEARAKIDSIDSLSDFLTNTYPTKKAVLDERLKKLHPSGPLYEAQYEMMKLREEIERLDTKSVQVTKERWELHVREQVMLTMSLLLREKNPDLRELFKEIVNSEENEDKKAKDGEKPRLALDTFLEYCKSAGADGDVLENIPLVFNSVAVGGYVLEDEFPYLAQVHYKLTQPTWLTETIDIGERADATRLSKGDIVEVIGKIERGEVSEAMPKPPQRMKVKTRETAECPSKEGYITVVGNKGSIFLKIHTFEYEVVKETVMTDQFEMKGFKVLKRLKAKDRFRALGFGLVEATSKAIRIKGRLVNNADLRGWATLVGNQGSAYLLGVE